MNVSSIKNKVLEMEEGLKSKLKELQNAAPKVIRLRRKPKDPYVEITTSLAFCELKLREQDRLRAVITKALKNIQPVVVAPRSTPALNEGELKLLDELISEVCDLSSTNAQERAMLLRKLKVSSQPEART